MPRIPAIFALPICFAVAACGAGGDRAAAPPPDPVSAPLAGVGDMCSYAERKEPVYVAHKFWTGRTFYGDLTGSDLPELRAKWFLGGTGGKVSTSVARPKLAVFRIKVDGNCYDEAKKVYYSCTKTVEAKLDDLRVLARAVEQRDADRLAFQICVDKMQERVEKQTQIVLDATNATCEVVARKLCPLPPPPPAPKKADDKKSN
jgi:hypothetical protein